MCQASGPDDLVMVHQAAYQPGDKLVFTVDEAPAFYVIRVDGAMDEAFVYLTCQSVEYAIPFEPDNPIQADRISYGPGCFIGERHYITLRRARAEETKIWWAAIPMSTQTRPRRALPHHCLPRET